MSEADLARVKQATEATYKYLHPVVREYLNEQLLDAGGYYEVLDWLERMEATRQFYEGKQAHGLGGPVKSRKRGTKVSP